MRKAMFDLQPEIQHQLTSVLRDAIDTSGDLGNLQLLDPSSGCLRIVAQFGFSPAFLRFFESTQEGRAACGTALQRRHRVVVEDVARDPIFAGSESREVMLAAKALAVQSTPLLSSTGMPLGVLSTHYGKATRPSRRALRSLDKIAREAAGLIERAYPLTLDNSSPLALMTSRSEPGPYAIYARIGDFVSFVESLSAWRLALERLEVWSLVQASEFVLFEHFDVVAVAQAGRVRRVGSWRLADAGQ